MSRSLEELTAHIDDDFKTVIEQLQAIFVRVSTAVKGRATHTYGAGARGILRIIAPDGFPASNFFKPGTEYPVIVRHSRPGGQSDDRTRDGSATSIKFFAPGGNADASEPGINDIMMNTGRVLFVNSARSFLAMVTTPNPERPEKLLKTGILKDNVLSEGYRSSGSFSDSYYHSQMCYQYDADDGSNHYIRYRFRSADKGPERGRYDPGFRPQGCTFLPKLDNDKRAENHLRSEFEAEVTNGDVRYLLQVQIRSTDAPEALNCGAVWDEIEYPWMDIGAIHLTEMLNADELDALSLDANRTPDCIKLPLATSADDYASLGHARALVYQAAHQARDATPKPHVG